MSVPEPPARSIDPRGGRLVTAALGLGVLAAYLANGREIGTYDTEPTSLLPRAILRGDGLHLDRFAPIVREPDGRLAAYVARKRGHVVSRYPVGPALLALPVYAVGSAVLDRTRPGWDRNVLTEWAGSKVLAKYAAATIAALAVVVLHRLLRRFATPRAATLAALAAGLGSDLWVVGGQALWQHGPAALALGCALLLLVDPSPSRLRFVLAGLASGALVAFRAIDVAFAAPIAAWVAWHQPRRLGLFASFPVAIAAALLGYNLHYFGTPLGGQAELEALHPTLHGVDGPWSGDLLAGLAGTLFSPARGLFVYTPWAALALATAPRWWRSARTIPLVPWASWGLVAYLLLLSKYAVWWGGFCYGPRYWTDAVPLLAAMLALALDAARRPGGRWLRAGFATTIGWAVALQGLGASCYPSSWNLVGRDGQPANVDTHHDRLWDWADSEPARCLRETVVGPLLRAGRGG